MPIDLDTLFGRSAPRVLEIGFGNGDSLVDMARANPAMDYLGVEVHEPGVGHCLIRISETGVSNLRLIMHDAIEVLEHQLGEDSVDRVNLYFPDPWPKKRHHKRRIVNPAFLALVASRLKAGGRLHIATDWENYATHIDETLANSTDFELDERREHGGSQPLDRPATRFEARGLKLGHRIWDWRFRRCG
jgi:tRNA (guanine-N7-)-methyltransferase